MLDDQNAGQTMPAAERGQAARAGSPQASSSAPETANRHALAGDNPATGGETTATRVAPALAMELPPSSRKSPKGARSVVLVAPETAIRLSPSATDDTGYFADGRDAQKFDACVNGEGGLQKRAADGLSNAAALPSPLDASPLVSEIVETWRRRQAFVEARRKLILQGKALCRRMTGGDKSAADVIYTAAVNGTDAYATIIVGAMLRAQEPLTVEINALDRHMVKLAKRLPVAEWAAAQKGFGIPGLGKTVGELGDLSAYHKGVAGVWKRAGLAVIDGGRQRKVAGDAALLHGYAPGRRSTFWNIAAAMLKGQGTGDASGPWRLIYDARKAMEIERVETPMHAHNRAMRFMTKRLLRELHRQWARANQEAAE